MLINTYLLFGRVVLLTIFSVLWFKIFLLFICTILPSFLGADIDLISYVCLILVFELVYVCTFWVFYILKLYLQEFTFDSPGLLLTPSGLSCLSLVIHHIISLEIYVEIILEIYCLFWYKFTVIYNFYCFSCEIFKEFRRGNVMGLMEDVDMVV